MKTKLKFLLPILLLTACNSGNISEVELEPLYHNPTNIELNTDEGYFVNTVTGDSIQPIITEKGDTLVTGIPILTQGKTIHIDSTQEPTIVQLSVSANTFNPHINIHKIPKDLTTIQVDEELLTSVIIKEIQANNKNHYVINEVGDTIPTGIPISLSGKKIDIIQPQPTKALDPHFKDAAIYDIRYLDVGEGMVSSNVYSMLEDKNGNFWFGTWGGGVSIYNGETFTNFTEKDGLSSNNLYSILEDKNGNFWFGTDGGGLILYNGNSFTNFDQKEGFINNTVFSILQDKNENIWFGTAGGVSKYNGKTFTHFTNNEGLSDNTVFSALEDKNGNLWFGTTKGGVNLYNGETFTHFTEKDGLNNNTILSLLEDQNGNIWLGTRKGVSKYDGKSFTHFTEKEGFSNNSIRSILEDQNGNIWFATSGSGAHMYDQESFTHFTTDVGLSNNNVVSILEDKAGNLWFGTTGSGVSIYNRKSFTHFTENNNLSSNTILSVREDRNNNIWFGTWGRGVSMYNGETFTNFTEKEGLSNNTVLSILDDKNGNIWFGTSGGGVSVFNGKSFTQYTKKQGLSSNTVFSMLEDNSGNIWFGTGGGGISVFNGKSFTHFTEKEGLSSNTVFSILEDKNGNIWFGTDGGGVSKYNKETFTHFTEKEGLSNNNVLSILEDKNGNIWFGTSKGVSIFNGETFTNITEKQGLSNDNVSSILEDNVGNIWISTEKGINRIMTEQLNTINIQSIVVYNKNDGLKAVNFFPNSACLDSKNRIWWGSGNSLTMLNLNKHSINPNPPEVSLKQLYVNNQFLDYKNIPDSLANSIKHKNVPLFENYPLNLELPYNKNNLTFHFAAIDWNAPHKIQYSYILEGLSTNWSKPNSEAKTEFNNLSHGNYVFKVKAIGESQEWSESFKYKFTILPPWWHSWWARIGYGAITLLLIFGLVNLRTAKLKKRQQELEMEIENATKEIREQKKQVEEAHREITDSINYAERIQRSFLATTNLLNENLNDYFVFFQPKDIVSGDFYWAAKLDNGNFAMVNADSTGHGVPGAIMSILNIYSIEKAIENGALKPAEIFNDSRKFIIDRLKKDGSPEGGKDGMDASIICFDFANNQLTYTAAQNPIWIIRGGKLIEIKPEKMPVGKHEKDDIPFKGGTFEIQKGDQIYSITDGFQDQFGGPKGKKFMVKRMREFILSISHLSMEEQQKKIIETFTDWKGHNDQVDDVCIVGVRI